MGQALYRKRRPKSLSEVVGQEHITKALEQALKAGTISHAYLFTGPRGVGKTSVARILAHAVNDLPYSDESMHLDIIEIDAASHRRIDEIRDLRERVHIAPTSAKYKVYIIDEVHMLTREAFNALLKTLEEPPAHVIFILATTEAHKLPETIISRTQRFNFRPIDEAKVVEHLADIAKAEKISIDTEALQIIARYGQGSFRDSIGLLDQVRNSGASIGLTEVLALLGQAPGALITAIVEAVAASDAAAVIKSLQVLQDQGYEPARVAKQLGETLRADLLSGDLGISRSQSLNLLAKLIEVPVSADPSLALEISLLASVDDKKPVSAVSKPASSKPQAAEVPRRVEIDKTPDAPAAKPSPAAAQDAPKKTVDPNNDLWPKVLDAIKQQHNTLYGIARMATPEYADGTLTLTFHFAFHQKRLNDSANRRIIANTIQELTGENIDIVCVLDKSSPPPTMEDNSDDTSTGDPNDPSLQNISNIFGGAELLQSE